MIETTPAPPPPALPPATEERTNGRNEASRLAFVEAIFDNLTAWTVIAAGIAFLYLVWATLEILSRYVGGLPSVTP